MLGNMNEGVEMRELRTTKTTSEAPVVTSTQSEVHHASLGRLLRIIADPRSDETHMAAAIQHHDKEHGGSHLVAQKSSPPRVLALSDHRHISNIGRILEVVDRAITSLSVDAALVSDATAARNLLRALASTMATQSVSECASTKANVCVWTPQSKKRLTLLQWLLRRSPVAFEIVVRGSLCGALAGDKTGQLTACLVIFELAQRDRRRQSSGYRVSGGDWGILLDPLVHAVQNGTVQTTTGPKASKLGVAALDALIAVLCLSTSQQQRLSVLETMSFVLSTLVQWNARSARRQWLLLAVRQLASMVKLYERDGTSETLEMMLWHWNASAMWLCARSDSVLAVKKTLTSAIARSIDDLYGISSVEKAAVIQHEAVTLLRRLCALLSLHTGHPAELFSTITTQGKMLIALAACLSAPTTRVLALDILKRLVVGQRDGNSKPVLQLSRVEVEAFVALVQPYTRGILKGDVASTLAELCLRSGCTIHDDHSASDSATATYWLSIVDRALDLYVGIPTFDQAMQMQWLRDTTRAVFHVLHLHNDKHVRSVAASLMPRLDLVLCIHYIASSLLLDIDTTTSGHLVAFVFHSAKGDETMELELANTLVDALCRGVFSPITIASPSDMGAKIADTDDGEKRQAALLAKSRDGWCAKVTETNRATILTVLIRKVFGSPRDSVFVTWLRELSLLGWFDTTLVDVLPIVTTHMKNLERLTEELLEDESPRTSRAVEQLLFARLAPNLVLRVIPRSAFLAAYASTPDRLLADPHSNGTGSLSDLAHALWSQVLDPFEFKDIKMLAIELLTKLPVHEILPHVLEQLIAFVSGRGTPLSVVKVLAEDESLFTENDGSFVTAKLLVYYLNLIFTDESAAPQDRCLLDKTLSVLLTVLSVPCPPNEAFSAEKSPLVDLQMGTIECLSLLVVKASKQGQNYKGLADLRLIEDALLQLILEGFSVDTAQQYPEHQMKLDGRLYKFQSWRLAVHDAWADHNQFSQTQVRICCCNILLSAFGKLDVDCTSTFQNRILRTKILPSLQFGQLPPPVLAGCLQIAFSFFFKAGASLERDDEAADDIATQSVAAVLQILDNAETMEDAVCMNALKLFGALIGKVTWLWPSLASKAGTHEAIATGLQNLRDSSPTTSSAVRQLAQSLLQAITSG